MDILPENFLKFLMFLQLDVGGNFLQENSKPLSINPWSAKPDICRARGVGSLYCFPRSPKNDFNNTEQV